MENHFHQTTTEKKRNIPEHIIAPKNKESVFFVTLLFY
jgi:hypothetical protein